MKTFEGGKEQLENLNVHDPNAFGTLSVEDHADWYINGWIEHGPEREGIGLKVSPENGETISYKFNEEELLNDFNVWWEGWKQGLDIGPTAEFKKSVYEIVVGRLTTVQGGTKTSVTM